jgi:hypothetical protein
VQIKVTHDIGDLASDLRKIATSAPVELRKVVRKNAMEGAKLARGYASQQHSMNSLYDIHYPKSITWDQPRSYYSSGGGNITAEYGPDPARPQGGMRFEHGSRKQKPHLDLNRSADVLAWTFGANVLFAADRLFWPES